jgi:pimeloyl-ACP methyl ester carboxylesterase
MRTQWIVSLLLSGAALTGCGSRIDAACHQGPEEYNEESSSEIRAQEVSLPVSAYTQTVARTWEALGAPEAGIVFVTGVDGGFEEPVDGIYQRLASHFARFRTASVFVKYREPGELVASVKDAIAAADWLKRKGIRSIAMVGWSFGGAVITHSAVRVPEVKTLVGLAAQSKDTEAVQKFSFQSLLLIHDYDDENVPYSAVGQILTELPAGIRAMHRAVSGSDHHLSGMRETVDPIAMNWLAEELGLGSCNPSVQN